MEEFLIDVCRQTATRLAAECKNFMPMGHIGICCRSKDRAYAENLTKEICQFDYKITFIEYPDDVEINYENAKDIINADAGIRLFVAIGDRIVAGMTAISSAFRDMEYILVANSPNLYGVGYALDEASGVKCQVKSPLAVLQDAETLGNREEYAQCVGIILGHCVESIEKKYVGYLTGRFDERKLNAEQQELNDVVGDGDMSDRRLIAEGMVRYARLKKEPFESSVAVLSKLIEDICLTNNRGESRLLAAIALIKYFKSILSVDNYCLSVPADVSNKCRRLAKITGQDISDIIKRVQNRNFQPKWLYIHGEYRQDMLAEVVGLEDKLGKIIKSAKRYMSDVGYHLGDDYDSNIIIELIYNLSPLTDECSLVAMADYLGIE